MIEAIVVSVIFGVILMAQEHRFRVTEEHHRTERAELIQRIQAPEQAVVSHATVNPEEIVLPVAFDDDDDAYLAERKRRAGLSD